MIAACSSPPCPFAGEGTVPCGRNAADLSQRCSVERRAMIDETVLTLLAPDRSFRRLSVMPHGRGVAATDGAEAATVRSLAVGGIDVRVGHDHYRLPAALTQ